MEQVAQRGFVEVVRGSWQRGEKLRCPRSGAGHSGFGDAVLHREQDLLSFARPSLLQGLCRSLFLVGSEGLDLWWAAWEFFQRSDEVIFDLFVEVLGGDESHWNV